MLVRTILTQIGALLGVALAVLFGSSTETLKQPLNLLVVVLALIVVLAVAAYDIYQAWQERPKRFAGRNRDEKTRDYMIWLLSHEGGCVMSSKDLSWATGDARDKLLDKARKHSLSLLLPYETDLSEELRAAGADVHYYADKGWALKSRFTIVNYQRGDAWLAVGLSSPDAHSIREIRTNDDAALNMAKDIAALAQRLANK